VRDRGVHIHRAPSLANFLAFTMVGIIAQAGTPALGTSGAGQNVPAPGISAPAATTVVHLATDPQTGGFCACDCRLSRQRALRHLPVIQR
jgi:hypothetical protein